MLSNACRTFTFTLTSAAALATVAGPASAHIQLRNPPQRTAEQKSGPCGMSGSLRGTPTTYAAGETIMIEWDETINHVGHYRLAFLVDGQEFPDPLTDNDNFPSTIQDLIPDRVVDGENGGGDDGYAFEYTFPNVACENCTLQLIQVMSVSPPYDESELYFQCADITLTGAAPEPDAGPSSDEPDAGATEPTDPGGDAGGEDGTPASGGTASGGCAAGGAGGDATAMSALLAFVAVGTLRRRRRATSSPAG